MEWNYAELGHAQHARCLWDVRLGLDMKRERERKRQTGARTGIVGFRELG